MAATTDHSRKEIKRAFITCVPYLFIIFFLDDLDKFLYTIHSRLGNPLLVLYMFTATVIIIALLIHSIIELRENYRTDGYIAVVPLIIYVLALANSFWSPLRISSEVFKNKITYRAFRKEQYGHALIKMRYDGKMDIRYPGPFGMADWEYGQWSRRGDTFFLHYDRGFDTVAARPDTLQLAPDGLLTPIGIPADSLRLYRDHFFRMPITKKK